MTSERRETTSSILSNRGDEDLSIFSSDARARSQSQVDCIKQTYNITLQATTKVSYKWKQERQITTIYHACMHNLQRKAPQVVVSGYPSQRPPNLLSHCVCGQWFTVEHALSCSWGGLHRYATMRFKIIMTATLMSKVCHMQCENRTGSTTCITGENFEHRTTEDPWCSFGIVAQSFWGRDSRVHLLTWLQEGQVQFQP